MNIGIMLDGLVIRIIATQILVLVEVYPFFFRKNLPVEILNVHKSLDGRKLLNNIKLENDTITLVNIYAPNNETI